MMEKEIDICIPFYNTHLNYFKECMNSIIKQTNKNFNLILLNDGSTNKDIDEYIKNEILNKDLGFDVYYYTQENIGLFKSRVALLKYTVSKYVYYLDSDDILFENAIDIMIKQIYHNIFNFNEPEIISFDYITRQDNLNNSKVNIMREKYNNTFVGFVEGNENVFRTYLKTIKGYDNTMWSRIYKRDFLLKLYNETYKSVVNIEIKITTSEDLLHTFMIFSCANSYLSIDKPIIEYNINEVRHDGARIKTPQEYLDYVYIINKFNEIDFKSKFPDDILELIEFRINKVFLKSRLKYEINRLLEDENTCDEIEEYFNSTISKLIPYNWKIVDKKLITDDENIL